MIGSLGLYLHAEILTDELCGSPLAYCRLVAPPTSVPAEERRDYGRTLP